MKVRHRIINHTRISVDQGCGKVGWGFFFVFFVIQIIYTTTGKKVKQVFCSLDLVFFRGWRVSFDINSAGNFARFASRIDYSYYYEMQRVVFFGGKVETFKYQKGFA